MEKKKEKEENIELTVAERIINIQNEIRLNKEGRNTFSKYNYFKPDDLNNALNPLLMKYNLLLVFNMDLNISSYTAKEEIITKDENKDNVYKYDGNIQYFACNIKICDAADISQGIEYTMDFEKARVKGANPMQNSGASMTYAKRYMLMNIFNIAENDSDYDSDNMTKTSKAEISVDDAYSWVLENLKGHLDARKSEEADWNMNEAIDKMVKALSNGNTTKDYLLKYYENKKWKE